MNKIKISKHTDAVGNPVTIGDWVITNADGRRGWVTHLSEGVDGETGYYVNMQVDVHVNIHIPASAVELYGGAKVFGRYPSPYHNEF